MSDLDRLGDPNGSVARWGVPPPPGPAGKIVEYGPGLPTRSFLDLPKTLAQRLAAAGPYIRSSADLDEGGDNEDELSAKHELLALWTARRFGASRDALDGVIDADIKRLAPILVSRTLRVEEDMHLRRSSLIAAFEARYTAEADLADLVRAVAALLAMRGRVRFGIEHVTDRAADLFGGPDIGRDMVVGSAGDPSGVYWEVQWLPDAGLTRYLGFEPDRDLLRHDLLKRHPICAVLPMMYAPGELAGILYWGEREELVAAGQRLMGSFGLRLRQKSEDIRFDAAAFTTDADVFAAYAPLMQLAAQELQDETMGDLAPALGLAAEMLAPPLFSTLEKVTMFGGFAVLVAGFALGGWAVAGGVLLGLAAIDLVLNAADVGIALDDLQEALQLADAQEADAVFETLDPALNQIEGGASVPMAWGFALFGMLTAVPVAGEFFKGARALVRGSSATTKALKLATVPPASGARQVDDVIDVVADDLAQAAAGVADEAADAGRKYPLVLVRGTDTTPAAPSLPRFPGHFPTGPSALPMSMRGVPTRHLDQSVRCMRLHASGSGPRPCDVRSVQSRSGSFRFDRPRP